MSKPRPATADTSGVLAYLATLEHPLKAQIEAVRQLILTATPALAKRIKWKVPSFFHPSTGLDFAAFHPRTTTSVHLVLVFPPGTLPADHLGLLEGDYPDRRMIYLRNMADVQARGPVLQDVARQWVAAVEGAGSCKQDIIIL